MSDAGCFLIERNAYKGKTVVYLTRRKAKLELAECTLG